MVCIVHISNTSFVESVGEKCYSDQTAKQWYMYAVQLQMKWKDLQLKELLTHNIVHKKYSKGGQMRHVYIFGSPTPSDAQRTANKIENTMEWNFRSKKMGITDENDMESPVTGVYKFRNYGYV